MDLRLPLYIVSYKKDVITLQRNVPTLNRVGTVYKTTKTCYSHEEFRRTLIEESCRLKFWIWVGDYEDRHPMVYTRLAESYPRHLTLDDMVSIFPAAKEIHMTTNIRQDFSCLSCVVTLEKLIIKSAVLTELPGIEFASSVRDITIEVISRNTNGTLVVYPGLLEGNHTQPLVLNHLDGMMIEKLTINPGTRPIRAGAITLPNLKSLRLDGDLDEDTVDIIREMQIPASCVICLVDQEDIPRIQKIKNEIEEAFPDNRCIDE